MFFFVLNNRVSNTYLFKMFFWKVFRVVNFFGHSLPQELFWGHESFTALLFLWILVTISSGFKGAVSGNGLIVAAFLRCQLCLLGKQNLAASCAFRLQITVECARTNPHKFYPPYFLFVSLSCSFYPNKFGWKMSFVLYVQKHVHLHIYRYLFIFGSFSMYVITECCVDHSCYSIGLWGWYILYVLVYSC